MLVRTRSIMQLVFIELLAAVRELEAFLQRAGKLTGVANIYVYETRIKGQNRNGLAVVYASYPSREQVRDTIARFPDEIRTYLPYLRTVDGIRREIAEREAAPQKVPGRG